MHIIVPRLFDYLLCVSFSFGFILISKALLRADEVRRKSGQLGTAMHDGILYGWQSEEQDCTLSRVSLGSPQIVQCGVCLAFSQQKIVLNLKHSVKRCSRSVKSVITSSCLWFPQVTGQIILSISLPPDLACWFTLHHIKSTCLWFFQTFL